MPPFYVVRSDRYEVLQGREYVHVDRDRIDGVSYHHDTMTVRFQAGRDLTLDCRQANRIDVRGLLQAIQLQRDRNHARRRARATFADGMNSTLLSGGMF